MKCTQPSLLLLLLLLLLRSLFPKLPPTRSHPWQPPGGVRQPHPRAQIPPILRLASVKFRSALRLNQNHLIPNPKPLLSLNRLNQPENLLDLFPSASAGFLRRRALQKITS